MTEEPWDAIVVDDPPMLSDRDIMALSKAKVRFVAVGEFRGEFATVDDLVSALRSYEATANANTTAWQRCVSPGALVVYRAGKDLIVYGETQTAKQAEESERADGAGVAEARAHGWRVFGAARRGWLWGKWYSAVVPEGEWGVIHRRNVSGVLTRGAFEVARASGWRRPWQQPGRSELVTGGTDTAASGEADGARVAGHPNNKET